MPNILVTGGAGFIGRNFTRFAAARGHKITVIDKLTYAGSMKNLADVKNKINFIKGDITNRKDVEKAMEDVDTVINFAAETHVDRSIKDAKPFIETNIIGTHILLEAARNSDVEKFVHISCYDEKTRALTTEGLKTFRELKKGDLVFSLNPHTMRIEAKPIEKIIIQPYDGKMIYFKNKRIDLFVTPNHKMFILNTSKRLIIETAEKALQRSIFYMPKGHWIGKEEEYINIDGHGKVKTVDMLYILGIFIGDGFTAYQEKEVETKSGLTRDEYLESGRDNSGRFMKVKKHSDYKSKAHSYRIFFDIPENDKCRKTVENTLSRLGINYKRHKGKAGTHLYFTSKTFMEFFDQCGKGAHNKKIPRWALKYSPKYLKHLLQGLLDSDGSGNNLFYTVSERLTSDVCELCIKLNLNPSIYQRYTKSVFNGRVIKGNSYYVFIANTTKSISRNRNKLVDYKGHIWCLKVKDNKNFIVERNGKFDFCGNTDEVYGSREKGFFRESDALNPRNPYSATKAAAEHTVLSYVNTYGINAVITRSSNNYGPYQNPEKFIPKMITNTLQNKSLPVYGKGLNMRDWLFVEDNCEAIALVSDKAEPGEVFNIGAGNEKRNIDVVKMILKMLGKPKSLIKFVPDRPGHDFRYALDITKIKELGWTPRNTFESGIRKTIDWYRNNEWFWKK